MDRETMKKEIEEFIELIALFYDACDELLDEANSDIERQKRVNFIYGEFELFLKWLKTKK